MANNSRLASYGILGTFGLVVLGFIGGIAYLAATGAIDTDIVITGNITLSGTIPLGMLSMALVGGVTWIMYIVMSDLYGSKTVNYATEQIEEVTGQGDGDE